MVSSQDYCEPTLAIWKFIMESFKEQRELADKLPCPITSFSNDPTRQIPVSSVLHLLLHPQINYFETGTTMSLKGKDSLNIKP